MIHIVFVFLSCFFSKSLAQTQCSNLGDLTVYFEPACSTTVSLGCNAGGQGQNCRFCGFDIFPPCPTTTVSTTISASSTIITTTQGSNNSGPLTDWEKAPDPVRRKYIDHPIQKPSILLNHNGPIPTNSWYENLLLGTGELVVNLLPIQIMAKKDGLQFGQVLGRDNFIIQENYVLQPFLADWTYKTNSVFTSKRVKNLKELSVTVEYTFLTGKMEIPLVRGMAFATAVYNGLVPQLSTIRAILNVKVDDSITYRPGDTTSAGNKFVINLNSGTYWVVYSSEKISFKINPSDITATNIANTVLKTALVGSIDTSASWNSYASGYVASADLSYQFNGDVGDLQYTWNIIGSNNALMFALPHHIDYLSGAQRTGIKAFSIKGEMEAIAGSSWLLKIPLSTISWNAKNPIDPSKRQSILNALREDQNIKATAPDPYWFGLELARSGRLALIADELGETSIASNIRSHMKAAIIPWLQGINDDPLRFY